MKGRKKAREKWMRNSIEENNQIYTEKRENSKKIGRSKMMTHLKEC